MIAYSLFILDIFLKGAFLSRDVPSRAALPIIRPELGRQHSISDRARVAMQGYLNQFLGNLDIVNSKEVYWGVHLEHYSNSLNMCGCL